MDRVASRAERAEARHRPACLISPYLEAELTAQSRHAHASVPRRAKRRTLGRSCSCPSCIESSTPCRPSTVRVPCIAPTPANKRLLLKALVAQTPHPACPRLRSSSQQHTTPATLPPPAASHPRGSRADSQHRSSRSHPRAATDAAVLQMGQNYSANIPSLQGARGPVGDREREGPGGLDPITLARSKDREHG